MNIKIIIALCLLPISFNLFGVLESEDLVAFKIDNNQEQEPARLSDIWDILNEQDPKPQSAESMRNLHGNSQEAFTILKWLKDNPANQNINSLALAAPIYSLSALCNHWAQQNAVIGLRKISSLGLQSFLALNFPHFASFDNLLENLRELHFSFPILLGHLKRDPFVSDESILELVKALKAQNNTVFLCVIDAENNTESITHSTLSSSLAFQAAQHALLARQRSWHNFEFALPGEGILQRALTNAKEKSPRHWHIERELMQPD